MTFDHPAEHHAHVDLTDRPVSEQEIDYVKSHLGGENLSHCDDNTIRRFIRATGGNLPLSVKRLQHTIAWQNDVHPETVICKACAKDPRSHYMHLVGYCSHNRPVIYSCLALASNRVYEDNKAHMIQTFETAIKCMPEGVEQWVWVCDFHGFGMADINPRLAKTFLDVSAEHYPERLGLFLVVDAPKLFSVLWNAIKYWVDPKTFKKIRFLPFDADEKHLPKSQLKAELDQHFESDTVSWILREMTDNRSKSIAKTKVYSMPSIHKEASSGDLRSMTSSETHDHRGTPMLLDRYRSCPLLLEPQALHTA